MLQGFKRSTTVVAVISIGAATNVYAALPTGVETAIEAAGTDAALVGGLVLVVLVGIMAFKWIRKAM